MARHLADVLAEVTDGNTAIDRHLPLIGLLLAGNHPEQGGLAGAVRTDEADLLALLQGRGSFDEEDLVADLLRDVIETDHRRLNIEIVAAALIRSRARGKDHSGPCGMHLFHAGCHGVQGDGRVPLNYSRLKR